MLFSKITQWLQKYTCIFSENIVQFFWQQTIIAIWSLWDNFNSQPVYNMLDTKSQVFYFVTISPTVQIYKVLQWNNIYYHQFPFKFYIFEHY